MCTNLSQVGSTAVWWTTNAWFVRWYEEAAMARRFGAAYEVYRATVPP